jgi:hypothetical protein
VFTARYALSPYIKQIRFVFKGLIGILFLLITFMTLPRRSVYASVGSRWTSYYRFVPLLRLQGDLGHNLIYGVFKLLRQNVSWQAV